MDGAVGGLISTWGPETDLQHALGIAVQANFGLSPCRGRPSHYTAFRDFRIACTLARLARGGDEAPPVHHARRWRSGNAAGSRRAQLGSQSSQATKL